MPYTVSTRKRTNRKSKPQKNSSLQKPKGVISQRVQKVGGEKFAMVCVDVAKHQSEWMMSVYQAHAAWPPASLPKK